MPYELLPTLNACLNAGAALLLVAGYIQIKRKHKERHRRCMIAAGIVSALFLSSYLSYHFKVGSVPFTGRGAVRALYFTILISHTILAAATLPLVLTTFYRAWRGDWARHRRLARWTLPVWLYVSVTGVVVYWMLYRLYPSGPG